MSELKHFRYEGSVSIRNGKQVVMDNKASIKSIEFLTPAKLTIISGDKELTKMVNVDIINHKVYDNNGDLFMSEEVFNHLESIHNVPDDFYAAPEELHDKVAEMDDERLKGQEEFLGEQNE